MYRLTPQASDDMVAIYVTGIELFGLTQSEAYLTALENTFDLIASNPQMTRQRTEISPPVHIQPHGSHIIIYDIDANNDVLILRVRHGHEDWKDQPIS